MNDFYKLFEEEKKALLKTYQTEVKKALKNTRDEFMTSGILLNAYREKSHEVAKAISKEGLSQVLPKYEEILLMDASYSKPEAFLQAIAENHASMTNDAVLLLSKREALSGVIRILEDKMNHPLGKTKYPAASLAKYWIGNEETEFLQLIYALIESGRLPKKGKIEMVKDIARFFGIKLSKNWQSNLSKSVHERKNNYGPSIFDELKEGWNMYVEGLINRKK